uniref:Putative heme/steroid binding protein n=1 Tax=Panstrongylus lignarius TaxID=156445 RepID=A0A224XVH9_9HEMI
MRIIHFIIPIIFGAISYICFINGIYFEKIVNIVHNLVDVYILGKSLSSKIDISSSGRTNEKLFTKQELSSFDGTNRKLYLSILGRVFDVTKGRKYYAPGEHYHGFIGRDASRAFITGDFSEEGLTDDLSNLLLSDLMGLKDWLKRYEKDYIYKGKLIGRFYDENGRSSSYLRDIESKCQEASKSNEQNKYYNLKYPPCNIEWSKEKGSRVWCSMKSGGVRRDWIGVPRKIFLPGWKDFRCACINPDLESLIDGGNVVHYDNCDPNSESCFVGID